ncbi:MAG TPA: glycosyltransferase family 2 protein [Solirubrobacteraceae bacterium]
MSEVSAVIVSYADLGATSRAVATLRAQTVAPTRIIVVDNDPASELVALEGASVVRPGRNLGYAGGANLGASRAGGEWLLLLNPDAVADRHCIERLLEAADDRTGIVGAQILLPDGRVNAGDNPLHFTGVSWSGRYMEPAEDGPPRSVAVASGAALLVRRAAWDAVGGLAEPFFLYHDDVDLSWRVRLAGWDVRFAPRARVRHDYDFDKGAQKWYWLERNRAWTVLCNYDRRTLALLAPMLAASEAAVLARSVAQGWWAQKLRAWAAVLRAAPAIADRRRAVQATRRVGDAEIMRRMTGAFATPLASPGLAGRLGPLLDLYRRWLVRRLD